jgi:hypothetical protein
MERLIFNPCTAGSNATLTAFLLPAQQAVIWSSRCLNTREGFPRGRNQPCILFLELLRSVGNIMGYFYIETTSRFFFFRLSHINFKNYLVFYPNIQG